MPYPVSSCRGLGLPRAATVAAAGPTVRGTAATGNDAPTLPTHQTGDVLVVFCGFEGTPGNLTASGWTRNVTLSGTPGKLYVYTKVAASSAETITLATQPNEWTSYAVQGGTAVDVTGSNVGGTDLAPVCPTVTTTGSADLLIDCVIAAYATINGNDTITMPTGETQAANVGPAMGIGNLMMRCGHKSLVASGATGTRTGSINGTGTPGWSTATVTIK